MRAVLPTSLQQGWTETNIMTSPDRRQCPSCEAIVAEDAVLCIDCGYHFARGLHLGTVVERPNSKLMRPKLDNPYESPGRGETDEESAKFREEQFDLTESGVRRAQAVVSEARAVFFVLFLASCAFGIGWFIMLPWYIYRLRQWHMLNSEFWELRQPNSFSRNVKLASEFQDARLRLILGIVVGSCIWLVAGFGFLQSLWLHLAAR